MTHEPRREIAPWVLPVVTLAVVVVGTTAIAALQGSESGLADLRVYREWAQQGARGDGWPVLDHSWVYPIGALPLVAIMGISSGIGAAFLCWLLAVFVANALAVIVLSRRGPGGRTAAWWWVLFLALLGPAALMRLEAFTGALSITAVCLLTTQTRAASAGLTVAGWIKVAPAAALLPLALVVSRPVSRVVVPAVLTSAGFVGLALAGGSGWRVLSFTSAQEGRGVQIESVVASGWQAIRLFGGGHPPHFDPTLKVYEFTGGLADLMASVMDAGLLLGYLLLFVGVLRARRRVGADSPALAALAVLATGLVLVVVNKVGSPQYLCWCAAGVVLGILATGVRSRLSTVPAGSLLATALLTRLVFPVGYPALLAGHSWVIVVLLARNVILVALLVWTVWQLEHMGRSRGTFAPGAAELSAR